MLLKNKNKLILSLIFFFLILSLTMFAFAVEEENINEQLEQLKNILNSSSYYSAFQTTMLLKSAQDLLEAGISFPDTRGIIENSVAKTIDAYSVKKVFDILLETKNDSLPTEPLINKINEGLAKNVNKNIIISVISTKAENLKQANEILTAAQQEGLEINGSEEIVEILADSLENDVPQESLSWLLKTGTKEGRSIEEILKEFPELKEFGITLDGVERAKRRPKNPEKLKSEYSGKKKRHTKKNVIVASPKNRFVLFLSHTRDGTTHDKRLIAEENLKCNDPTISACTDSGFQGLKIGNMKAVTPKKNTKFHKLSDSDKEQNKAISSVRVVAEHAIAGVKINRSVQDVYRNMTEGMDDLLMSVACGLHNLRVVHRQGF